MTVYKLLPELFILAFCIKHLAGRCCKHW